MVRWDWTEWGRALAQRDQAFRMVEGCRAGEGRGAIVEGVLLAEAFGLLRGRGLRRGDEGRWRLLVDDGLRPFPAAAAERADAELVRQGVQRRAAIFHGGADFGGANGLADAYVHGTQA